jgi:hypothetical protein
MKDSITGGEEEQGTRMLGPDSWDRKAGEDKKRGQDGQNMTEG